MAPKIVKIARGENGVREIGNTNRGKQVDAYKAATWLDPRKLGHGAPRSLTGA